MIKMSTVINITSFSQEICTENLVDCEAGPTM